MTTRMMISLEAEEREALIKMSENEYRNPKMQIRLILRSELERRGLLSQHEAPTLLSNCSDKKPVGNL